jgi:MFS family permease
MPEGCAIRSQSPAGHPTTTRHRAHPVPASKALGNPAPIHRDPQFRRLWVVGGLVSLIRWLEILAFAVFTYDHTQSALWVASLMMLRMLPLAVFGLALGALAARVSRRAVLLATHALLLASCLVLMLLALLGAIEVWHLAAASALHGTVWACDMPMRRGLMGDIAGPGRVAQAMSLDAVTANACRLVGPMLGGLLIARGGLPVVFLANAVLYLPVLFALLRLREPPVERLHTRLSLRTLLSGGFQAARESPLLRAALWLTILFNLFAWPVLSMVPVIGREQLRLDPQGVGVLASLDGVGSLIGALVLSTAAGRLRQGPVYLGAVVAFLLLQMVLAWSPVALLTGLALLLLGLVQAGFAVMQTTLVYTATAEARRPEAMGLMTMCIGASPLGFLAVGALAERLGAPGATLLCGVCGLLGVALTWPVCRACLREPGRG